MKGFKCVQGKFNAEKKCIELQLWFSEESNFDFNTMIVSMYGIIAYLVNKHDLINFKVESTYFDAETNDYYNPVLTMIGEQ